ncbi:energy transducer TonB [Hufsiella ginkgonis]|uniref:TonB family protein n=1 Tax=Hufsiella ginkgonis TaxID=2695274 RepID=A0A7K1XWN0_9SPHI|nr:energy transducer TonB [Hufsiella ginkgonis]MXV15370.1 TonB family protein [Hufsiella ginkgonis]
MATKVFTNSLWNSLQPHIHLLNPQDMLSFKTNVYRNEWLDLVFAKRNQLYGAYELRRNYSSRLSHAMLISAALFVSAITGPFLYNKYKGPEQANVPALPATDSVVVILHPEIEPPKKKPLELPKAAAADPVKVKTVRFVAPAAAPEQDVIEDMPDLTDLRDAAIGDAKTDGVPVEAGVAPIESPGKGGTGTAPAEEGEGDKEIFRTAEVNPQFPGGQEAFAKFIRKNLHYPPAAVEAGINGKVIVSFVVERDGSISNVQLMRGIGYGCDQEAIRVLKKVPNWIPGEQNGRKVRVMYTVPLNFQTTE